MPSSGPWASLLENIESVSPPPPREIDSHVIRNTLATELVGVILCAPIYLVMLLGSWVVAILLALFSKKHLLNVFAIAAMLHESALASAPAA